MKFTIEIRDYERGDEDHDITIDRLETAVVTMLDNDGSDGIVIVTTEDDE
jgi:hypothetical protein